MRLPNEKDREYDLFDQPEDHEQAARLAGSIDIPDQSINEIREHYIRQQIKDLLNR